MSSNSGTWCALFVVGLAGACVEYTPLGPSPDTIVVHAVLNPAQAVQHVVVWRAASGAPFEQPVRGAIVRLTAPDGPTFVATEGMSAGDSALYIAPTPQYDIAAGPLTPGEPYRLQVTLRTGEVVEGETSAPVAAPVTAVTTRRFNRETDTLRLSWPRVAGAQAYEVRMIAQRDSFFVFGEYVSYADTSIALPGSGTGYGSSQVFLEGIRYDLVISAVDPNYYAYYSHLSDPYTATELPTSLSGAFGVFGAIVPIIRMTIEVEGTPPWAR
jgi:hypothetical protein